MDDRWHLAHRSRVWIMIAGASLALAACGSGDAAPADAVDPSTPSASQTAEAPASEPPPEPAPSVETSPETSDHGLGATITIGAETWQFELSSVYPGGCWVDANGIDTGGSVDADTLNVTFSAFDLRGDGGDLRVTNDAAGERWIAAADRETMTTYHLLPDGSSQIDSITIDGGRITGTATFIEMNAAAEAISTNGALPASRTGSFDIRCPG
jgi:hypothetical protein